MKLASVNIPDAVAHRAGHLWPDQTWSQVVTRALDALVDAALLDEVADVEAEPAMHAAPAKHR